MLEARSDIKASAPTAEQGQKTEQETGRNTKDTHKEIKEAQRRRQTDSNNIQEERRIPSRNASITGS